MRVFTSPLMGPHECISLRLTASSTAGDESDSYVSLTSNQETIHQVTHPCPERVTDPTQPGFGGPSTLPEGDVQ